MLTVYLDPYNRDLYLTDGQEWAIAFHGVHPLTLELVDESVVPDNLEIMVPLMPTRRRPVERPVVPDLATAAAQATGPLWTENDHAA